MKKTILIILAIMMSYLMSAQRVQVTINDGWRFSYKESASSDNDWEDIRIPHTWNNYDAFDDKAGYYRGEAVYRRKLYIPDEWISKSIYIKFEGVNQDATVFLNGQELCRHKGGYTAFRARLDGTVTPGENLLEVRVSNAHNRDIPPLNADFTFYGGIYRDVRIEVVSPVHFDMDNCASDGVFIRAEEEIDGSYSLDIKGMIANRTSGRGKFLIKSRILDREGRTIAAEDLKTNCASDSNAQFQLKRMKISSPILWTPENPYLYVAEMSIYDNSGNLSDRLSIPFGTRTYRFDGEGFYLNGEKYTLRGACRHQDLEGLGNALPNDVHIKDFEDIKSLGFNFVRLAHYPQDPEVYRMCDRLGLLVWSEIPVVNQITNSQAFFENAVQMQKEHIRQTFNHPSIIIYGYMNEVLIKMLSDSRMQKERKDSIAANTIRLARELQDVTKAESSERYTAMAVHYHEGYNQYGITEIPDIIGYNLYFGWYYETLSDLKRFLDEEHRRYPDRPIIVSEYGAGSDIRIHSDNPRSWDFSEEYQLLFNQSFTSQFNEMPYLAGYSLWIYSDFGSASRGDTVPFVNQKGLVTFDRHPKSSAYLYRALFSKEPIIKIAEENNTERSCLETSRGCAVQTIRVISNENSVELFLNGARVGTNPVVDGIATFSLEMASGINHIEAVSDSGIRDAIDITVEIVPRDLSNWDGDRIGVNVGSHLYFRVGNTTYIPDVIQEGDCLWGRKGGVIREKTDRQVKTGISNNIKLTEYDHLYQTFCEDIESFHFNVQDGIYRVTLHFVEGNPASASKDLIYNLSQGGDTQAGGARVFSVGINGCLLVGNLDLEHDYGRFNAVDIPVIINTDSDNGVTVTFHKETGKTTLSGILIERL